MGRIPQYVGNNRPTSEPGSVFRKDENVVTYQDPDKFRNLAGESVGKQLTDLGEKMQVIENANSESKSNIDSQMALSAIQDEVDQNPDPNHALDSVDNKVSMIRQAAAKNFRNADARDKYLQEFDLKAGLFKIGLQAKVYKKQVDIGRVNTLREMDMEASNYINAPDESSKLASRQKIQSIMDRGIQNDLFSHEQGMDEFNKIIKSADDAVDNIERLKARKAKELAWAEEKAKSAIEQSYMKMKKSGVDKLGMPATVQDMITMATKDNTLDPQFKALYINALTSPKAVKAKTKSVSFSNLMSDINKGIKNQDKIRSDILKDNSDGYLSNDDASMLNDYLDMLSNKNPDDLIVMDMRKSWLGVEVFSENTAKKEESRRRMSLSYISKINSGIEPKQASIEAMQEEVLYLHPEVIGKPDGAEYMDDSGRLKKIMPNGDIVEVQSNKKDTRVKEKK